MKYFVLIIISVWMLWQILCLSMCSVVYISSNKVLPCVTLFSWLASHSWLVTTFYRCSHDCVSKVPSTHVSFLNITVYVSNPMGHSQVESFPLGLKSTFNQCSLPRIEKQLRSFSGLNWMLILAEKIFVWECYRALPCWVEWSCYLTLVLCARYGDVFFLFISCCSYTDVLQASQINYITLLGDSG